MLVKSLSLTRAALALTLALGLSCAAHAELPTGTSTFITPTGTAGALDPIEVWVRFTLNAGSVPLNFSSDPLAGLDTADLPLTGQYYDPDLSVFVSAEFTSYTGAYLNTYFGCSGTFTSSCITGTDYNFNFWTSSEPGQPSLNFLESYTLAPGASVDYLFGIFNPTAGGATPGSYVFYSSGLTLNVRGFDADGHSLTAEITTLADTCASSDLSCAFTRTVTPVPEPTSHALMAVGLLALGGWIRRRRHTRAH